MSSATTSNVDPIRPYRGVRVQLDEDEDNHQQHTQEDEYQSFVTGNNTNNSSSGGRFQSFRQLFSWNRGSNDHNTIAASTTNENNSAILQNDEEEETRSSPFLFSNLSPNVRRRIVVFLTISMLFIIIIALHFILVAAFVSPSSSTGNENENSDSSDTSSNNNFRNVLLYTLTIPNAILFSCIAFCCSCLWGKRILTCCLNHNRSRLVRNFKYYLLKYGLVRYEGEHDDWEGDEISERNQRLLELLQSRGMEVNSLRLMMVDRDFNANDYETLLQLDGHHSEPRGVSENTLSRLTLFRIPPLSAVEHSNDDADLYTGTPSNTVDTDQDSSVPYCSENLGRTLLEESCCICLSKYESGEVVCTLPTCLHRYHRDCVFQALRMRNQCPICKTAV